jgi:hypothetical protein
MLIGKGFGFWNHPDPLPERDYIHGFIIDIIAVEQHLAPRYAGWDKIVHAVKHAQKRRFPAARRPDDSGNRTLFDVHSDVPERVEVSVMQV